MINFYKHYLLFNFLNKQIHCVNIINFYKFILLFNNNTYIIFNTTNFKYSWAETYFSSDNDFLINYINIKKNLVKNKKICYNKNLLLNEIISLKKKTSLIKKNTDLKYIDLNRSFLNKENFINNFHLNKTNKKANNLNYFYNNFNKSIDLNKKTKMLFNDNRKIIKNLFNLKYYRKFSLNKNLKKICNFNKKDFIYNYNNSLFSILLKSDFFFSKFDCIWFIKNGFISVNSIVTKNKNLILKIYDTINIINSSYYYSFYKLYFSNLLSNIYKVNLKFWSINKNKYRNTDSKKITLNYPKWIENYKYFKKDIPQFLEIDYISMTVVIINLNLKFKQFDYFDFKFINLYLNRLYNWKFII